MGSKVNVTNSRNKYVFFVLSVSFKDIYLYKVKAVIMYFGVCGLSRSNVYTNKGKEGIGLYRGYIESYRSTIAVSPCN